MSGPIIVNEESIGVILVIVGLIILVIFAIMPQSNEPDNKKPAEDFIVTFDNLPRYSYFIVVGSSRMLYKGAEGEVVDPGGYREHINYDTKVIKVNRAQFG